MYKFIFASILLYINFQLSAQTLQSIDSELFQYNNEEVNQKFSNLTPIETAFFSSDTLELNKLISEDKQIDKQLIPFSINEYCSPGSIPSFWWSFCISAVGTYTVYGIGAGPISVIVVYYASGKSKKEVRKSIWGWVTGTLTGAGAWILLKSI